MSPGRRTNVQGNLIASKTWKDHLNPQLECHQKLQGRQARLMAKVYSGDILPNNVGNRIIEQS